METNAILNSLSSYAFINISGTNNNLNTLSSYTYLNIKGTNINLDNKIILQVYVSGASTLLSSLNIVGNIKVLAQR